MFQIEVLVALAGIVEAMKSFVFTFPSEHRAIPISSLRPHAWHRCLDAYCTEPLVRPHEILCSTCLTNIPVPLRMSLAKATPWSSEWRRIAKKVLLTHLKLDRVTIDYLTYVYETTQVAYVLHSESPPNG